MNSNSFIDLITCDPFMVDRSIFGLSPKFCRDAFGAVTALFCGEHGHDFRAEDRIAKLALLVLSCTKFQFVIRGTIQRQNITEPLNRVGFSRVTNEPKTDHQSVSSAKYLAALRRMSPFHEAGRFSFPMLGFVAFRITQSPLSIELVVPRCRTWGSNSSASHG